MAASSARDGGLSVQRWTAWALIPGMVRQVAGRLLDTSRRESSLGHYPRTRYHRPMSPPGGALVVGAGPAGLAAAACLRAQGVSFEVLEASERVGNAWFEHLTYYDGEEWVREIFCPQTDNILDNRPAMVGIPSGEVVIVGSTDGRFAMGARLPQWFVRELAKTGEKVVQKAVTSKWPDPVNNELMMAQGLYFRLNSAQLGIIPNENGKGKQRRKSSGRGSKRPRPVSVD